MSPLLTEADDQLLYQRGRLLSKGLMYLRCIRRRARDVKRARGFAVVFVAREALPTGSVRFEQGFRASGARMIYDFDDAIWNLDVSGANRAFGWLKRPAKTAELIGMSDRVIAGNAYLAQYARRFSDHVTVIPTTIDTDRFVRSAHVARTDRICIGWSGSATTIKHFEHALPALRELQRRYGDRVQFKVFGANDFKDQALEIRGRPWAIEDELTELSTFDVGIMPLPDDEWSKGKCGLKGLQYMSLSTPTVMSPVGVNGEIIRDGVNGFLAGDTEEWVAKMAALVESAGLRQRIGRAGRRTVENAYSVRAQRERYLELLRHLTSRSSPTDPPRPSA